MLKLFCIPYAGSSASVFSSWSKHLDELSIQIIPVELAGRGNRMGEPFYEDIDEAVKDVYKIVCDHFDGSRYALFGHSMGSTIIYELYYRMKQMNKPEPELMFFSGSLAPHLIKRDVIYHKLDEKDLMYEVLSLGGTNKDVFENKYLRELFVPIIRNDYRIIDNYKYRFKKEAIKSEAVILYGINDEKIDEIKGWDSVLHQPATYHLFEGGHFFINDKKSELLRTIENHIKQLIQK